MKVEDDDDNDDDGSAERKTERDGERARLREGGFCVLFNLITLASSKGNFKHNALL